jgi:lipopolysaccharide export LptBFGC system permease protein LptF
MDNNKSKSKTENELSDKSLQTELLNKITEINQKLEESNKNLNKISSSLSALVFLLLSVIVITFISGCIAVAYSQNILQ